MSDISVLEKAGSWRLKYQKKYKGTRRKQINTIIYAVYKFKSLQKSTALPFIRMHASQKAHINPT